MDEKEKVARILKKVFLASFIFTFLGIFYYLYAEDYIRYYKLKEETRKQEEMRKIIIENLKEFREKIRDKEYQKLFIEKKVKLPDGCEAYAVGLFGGVGISSSVGMFKVECKIEDEDGKPYVAGCVYSPITDTVDCK